MLILCNSNDTPINKVVLGKEKKNQTRRNILVSLNSYTESPTSFHMVKQNIYQKGEIKFI